MQITYKLNPANAKQVGQPGRIDEKGAYSGTFVRAEHLISQKGTSGIEFSFRSDSGQTADYLTLWISSASGSELYGKKILDALMTCLRCKSLSSTEGTVRKYSREAGAEVTATATIFPDLMNKPIGLLLVREEYQRGDGTVGSKMAIAGCYEAATGKLPREVLENLPAESLQKVAESLRDRPLKNRPTVPTTTSGEEFDDDVPF